MTSLAGLTLSKGVSLSPYSRKYTRPLVRQHPSLRLRFWCYCLEQLSQSAGSTASPSRSTPRTPCAEQQDAWLFQLTFAQVFPCRQGQFLPYPQVSELTQLFSSIDADNVARIRSDNVNNKGKNQFAVTCAHDESMRVLRFTARALERDRERQRRHEALSAGPPGERSSMKQ